MLTGQTSSHARQLVHAQISSEVIRSNTEFDEIVISESVPSGGPTWPCGELAAMTSPTFKTISRGSSGLPVAWAGHTLVHRPHIVHASVSSNCFHVKSSTTDAPNVSSEVSVRLGIARIAPFGRSRSRRYMLSGDVNMCRNIVMGSSARKTTNAMTCSDHMIWCHWVSVRGGQAIEQLAQRVPDEAPLLVARLIDHGDPKCFCEEAGRADHEERAEDGRVLRLGLDADAIRALHIPTHDRPDDADHEHETGKVGEHRVGEVGRAVEELGALRHLVVDFEHRGDTRATRGSRSRSSSASTRRQSRVTGCACTRRHGSRRDAA